MQEKFKKERDFFREIIVLQAFEGSSVKEGNYEYKFEYKLPDNLPGVFNVNRRGHRGAIVYKVKAYLDMPGKDIKSKTHIVVVPSTSNDPKPVQGSASKKFLFGGSGRLNLTASIDKDIFSPGESVPVKVQVENNSKKSVAALKVKLMRTVHLKCEKGLVETWTEEVNRQVYDGVDKKSSDERTLEFQLAEDIFPSTKGELVHCSYNFDVECDVKMAFDLEVKLPIHVLLMPAEGAKITLFDNLNWKD